MSFKTEQEEFWATEFGGEYIERNKSQEYLSSNVNYFSNIFKSTQKIDSVIEFGANIGMNLKAIKCLLPNADIEAVEINKDAFEILHNIPNIKAYNESILDFKTDKKYNFVFTKGVLIHINPDMLQSVYEKMYNLSSKYICIGEYYNPNPVSIPYRGHDNKLFKRDFAGEIMEKYPDLKLINYGFCYKRDNNFAQDDITWFIMEKK